jgi:hypothetical protein
MKARIKKLPWGNITLAASFLFLMYSMRVYGGKVQSESYRIVKQ